jgi:DNA-binding IclR family transcriptional regulator
MNNVVPYSGTKPLGSVANAIAVLKAFGRQGEWGVTELSQDLGLGKSVTHRLLQTLVAGGLVEQIADRGTYVLAMELIHIARAAARRTALGAVAHRHLEKLANRAEGTALLTVLRSQRCLYIDVVEPIQHIDFVVQLGDTVGLHAGAGGKAILAFQPPSFRDEVLAKPLARYTDQTICDKAELEAELAIVRQCGHAKSDSEVTPGCASVAAPIRDHGGSVIASVTVTTSSLRMREIGLDRYRHLVVGTAQDISADLGYRRPAAPNSGRRTA